MTRRKQLVDAIVDALTLEELTQAVRVGETDLKLASKVGPGDDLETVAFKLVEWADRQDRVADLARACWRKNPGNAALAAFAMWVRYFAPAGDGWLDDEVAGPRPADAGAQWDADVFFSFAADDEAAEDALRMALQARPDPSPAAAALTVWGWAADAAPPQWVIDRAARTRAWVVATSANYARHARSGRVNWLSKDVSRRLTADQPGTLAAVALDDAPPGALPPALATAKPLRLFTSAAGAVQVLRSPDPAYFALVEDLARVVSPAPPVGPPKGAVFLAEVTDDLDDDRNNVRDDVKRFLNQAGWAVLPDQLQYPRTDEAAFEAAVAADLAQCKLFVQLLSELPGKLAPPARARTFVRIQYDLAAARSPAIPILQWRRRNLDPAGIPEAHRKLLEGLDGREVLAEDLQAFKDEILRVLNKPADPVPESDDANILIQSWDDAQQVQAIVGVLDGMGVWYGVRDGADPGAPAAAAAAPTDAPRSPAARAATKPPPLAKYDGLIVVYGQGRPPQISEYLMDVWEAAPGQYFGLGVYHAPPPPPQRQPLLAKLPRVETLDCRGGFKEPVIRNFVERVRKLKRERTKG